MVELVEPDREAVANLPALAIELEPDVGWYVRARNLRPDLIASLGGRLESLLRVSVAEAGDHGDLPNVFGDHEIRCEGVRFIPHYPFEPGVPFRAILDLRVLGRPDFGETQTLEFSIPRVAGPGDTEVREVFPSSDMLPENLLRFYVRFSRPMQRGRARDHIEVLGPDGGPAPDVLYRPPLSSGTAE